MKIAIIILGLLILAVPASAAFNVEVHVNYPADTVYIGMQNRFEIWIENSDSIMAMSLGFVFEGYTGDVNWSLDYGDNPPCNIEYDAREKLYYQGLQNFYGFDNPSLPDSLLRGAVFMPFSTKPIPPGSSRMIFSYLFSIPESEAAGELCVDNVFFPPAGEWKFACNAQNPYDVVPNYNGCQNTGSTDPDCPAVCFPVRECPYIIGDLNVDGHVNVADPVWLMNHIFMNGPDLAVWIIGDVNCNGRVNIGDVVYIFEYIFVGGNQPCNF